ncbi:hypothetical protein V5O48_012251 [Marasmius crinis-equi]|uniref:VWFA domain-containing protein n=1 Tax=Marasmius crinis-equi TaxID=585013 RepID=A0ABR3F3D2_9AGAR
MAFGGAYNPPYLSDSAQFGFNQPTRQQTIYPSPTMPPPLPVGEGLFTSNPGSPLGSPYYEGNYSYSGRVNSPPSRSNSLGLLSTKRQQWIQQATERTRSLQSGSFHPSAISWSYVSNGILPQNAIDLGNEAESMYLCRSFYENQLRVGRVTPTPEGLKAFITCKGKDILVKEYEVLIQSLSPPQFSFARSQTANLSVQSSAPKASNKDLVDIVFIVDDSDSMDGSRWREVRDALLGITETCRDVDADGFDLFFLNHDFSKRDILDEQGVLEAFNTVGSPDGATPTGARLRKVLDLYLPKLEQRASKPVSIVVITDGDPSDDVEQVIVDATQRLETFQLHPSQLSIHFVQIGDDPAAAAALKHLDDALEHKYQIPDIVETTINQGYRSFTTETLSSVVRSLMKKQSIQGSLLGPSLPAPSLPGPSLPGPSLLGGPSLPSPKPFNPLMQSSARSGATQPSNLNPQKSLTPVGQRFANRKDWIHQAKQLTAATLTPNLSPSSLRSYTWIFVESGVPPANSIICGNENNQDTFFARSFYEGQLRYGTIIAGASKATVIGNGGREASVEQYEVLVQASSTFYSFVSEPSVAQNSGDNMDVVLIIDDSDSMTTDGRWNQARDALASVAENSYRFDDDGVDMFFINNEIFRKNIKTRNEVIQLFNSITPDGATPTGARLRSVLQEYIPLVEQRARTQSVPKPVNVIVITDGDPTDDVETIIVQAAQQLHRVQVPERLLGIQFVQIGNDLDATRALQKLDSALEKKHNIRDMVDTTLYDPSHPELTAEMVYKILFGAISKQVDHIGELKLAI